MVVIVLPATVVPFRPTKFGFWKKERCLSLFAAQARNEDFSLPCSWCKDTDTYLSSQKGEPMLTWSASMTTDHHPTTTPFHNDSIVTAKVCIVNNAGSTIIRKSVWNSASWGRPPHSLWWSRSHLVAMIEFANRASLDIPQLVDSPALFLWLLLLSSRSTFSS